MTQLTEEELSAKKAKEDKAVQVASLYITVAVSMVVSVAAFMFLPYILASLMPQGRRFGIPGYRSRSICKAGTVYGIYDS